MIDRVVAELESGLRVSRRHRRRIVDEARDHLEDSANHLRRKGLDDRLAEDEAVRRFGDLSEMARQFNLQAEWSAIRARLVVGAFAGVLIGASFVLGANANVNSGSSGRNWLDVVAFQLGVVASEIAVVAGIRFGTRVLALPPAVTPSADDRQLVTNTSRVLAASLSVAALCLGAALALASQDPTVWPTTSWVALVGLTLGMCASIALWPRTARTTDSPQTSTPSGRRSFRGLPDRAVGLVRTHPVAAVGSVAVAAGLGAMSHAETTVWQSVPWGVGQALAVLVGFVLLGPVLGLRPTAAAV